MSKQLTNYDKKSLIGTLVISTYRDGKLIREQTEKNLVVSSSGHGRNLVMRQLIGDTTYGLSITKAKIGTGSTAPTDSDTDLETEVLDNILVATKSVTNDTANFQFYIPAGDLADGTYREFGMFIGSQLFCRALFSVAYSKSTGEDTRIDYSLEFTG